MSGGLEIKGAVNMNGIACSKHLPLCSFKNQVEPVFMYICMSLTEHCNLII